MRACMLWINCVEMEAVFYESRSKMTEGVLLRSFRYENLKTKMVAMNEFDGLSIHNFKMKLWRVVN